MVTPLRSFFPYDQRSAVGSYLPTHSSTRAPFPLSVLRHSKESTPLVHCFMSPREEPSSRTSPPNPCLAVSPFLLLDRCNHCHMGDHPPSGRRRNQSPISSFKRFEVSLIFSLWSACPCLSPLNCQGINMVRPHKVTIPDHWVQYHHSFLTDYLQPFVTISRSLSRSQHEKPLSAHNASSRHSTFLRRHTSKAPIHVAHTAGRTKNGTTCLRRKRRIKRPNGDDDAVATLTLPPAMQTWTRLKITRVLRLRV